MGVRPEFGCVFRHDVDVPRRVGERSAEHQTSDGVLLVDVGRRRLGWAVQCALCADRLPVWPVGIPDRDGGCVFSALEYGRTGFDADSRRFNWTEPDAAWVRSRLRP